MHYGRYRSHDDQHHSRERIDLQRPEKLEVARRHPFEQNYRSRIGPQSHDKEQVPGDQRREHQERASDNHRRFVADHPPEKAGDERAQQRQQYDRSFHTA